MSKKHVISAFIYDKRGKLLSWGRNSYLKTHPLQAKMAQRAGTPERVFLHAEIAALAKLKDWSKAHKMVVTRFDSLGNPVLAKPCTCCIQAISLSGISILEHT
jgi:tRNA(Arg) A34 adenosine deaminase TadA